MSFGVRFKLAVASLKQHPATLAGIAANIVSAVLCYPGDYPAHAVFFRAVVIYVFNVLLCELPRWKDQRNENRPIRDVLQVCMVILGALLVGFGFLFMSKGYDSSELPQSVTTGEWVYFVFALVMLALSILSNLDLIDHSSRSGSEARPVLDSDPSKPLP